MSMPAQLQETWKLYAGDDAFLDLTVTAGGLPLDLTGFELRAAWRESVAAASQVELNLQVINAPAGQLRLSIDHNMTSVDAGVIRSGVFDIQTVNPDGLVRTLVTGKTKWREDVTR